MTPDVDWANGWEGGSVSGREAVRDYRRHQWEEIDFPDRGGVQADDWFSCFAVLLYASGAIRTPGSYSCPSR
jgi:hypothetical protein